MKRTLLIVAIALFLASMHPAVSHADNWCVWSCVDARAGASAETEYRSPPTHVYAAPSTPMVPPTSKDIPEWLDNRRWVLEDGTTLIFLIEEEEVEKYRAYREHPFYDDFYLVFREKPYNPIPCGDTNIEVPIYGKGQTKFNKRQELFEHVKSRLVEYFEKEGAAASLLENDNPTGVRELIVVLSLRGKSQSATDEGSVGAGGTDPKGFSVLGIRLGRTVAEESRKVIAVAYIFRPDWPLESEILRPYIWKALKEEAEPETQPQHVVEQPVVKKPAPKKQGSCDDCDKVMQENIEILMRAR